MNKRIACLIVSMMYLSSACMYGKQSIKMFQPTIYVYETGSKKSQKTHVKQDAKSSSKTQKSTVYTKTSQTPPDFVAGRSYTAPQLSSEAELIKKIKQELLEEKGVVAPGVKPHLTYASGDVKAQLGGSLKFDSFFAKNSVFLNKHIPDEFSYFKQTFDLTFDFAYGEQQYGHKAVEVFADIRQKLMWGNVGAYSTVTKNNTDLRIYTPLAFDSSLTTKSHNHILTKPALWVRDLWMQLSFNALCNKTGERLQFVKFGLFPFWLGRGIALGSIYGASKEFLGIYTGYQNDVSAPGINFHGDVIKDKLSYDFYYAKLEEKSACIADTFNHVKAYHVGRSSTPWRGTAKDNDLIAARLQATVCNDRNCGKIELEPYVMYNEASDRKIEFEADAKSELGTAGFMVEWKKKRFECGGEFAANFGQEHVYNIDRNRITIMRDSGLGSPYDDSALREFYSHLKDGASLSSNIVLVTADTKDLYENSKNSANSDYLGTVSINGSSVPVYNASNRFRPEYENRYRGFMGVVDMAYLITEHNLHIKPAVAYGYASGDLNPHDNEVDKTYMGFIGLQEAYAGKRVPSVFVLDARKLKRPLTLMPDFDRKAGDDGSFTDMHYIGLGLTWYPKHENYDKLFASCNTLIFWKDQPSRKSEASGNARRTLGTEVNFRTKYEALSDLYLFADFAIFIPGEYYKDVKGTSLRSDIYDQLDQVDQTRTDSDQYRLAHNTAFLFNAGITYKF